MGCKMCENEVVAEMESGGNGKLSNYRETCIVTPEFPTLSLTNLLHSSNLTVLHFPVWKILLFQWDWSLWVNWIFSLERISVYLLIEFETIQLLCWRVELHHWLLPRLINEVSSFLGFSGGRYNYNSISHRRTKRAHCFMLDLGWEMMRLFSLAFSRSPFLSCFRLMSCGFLYFV